MSGQPWGRTGRVVLVDPGNGAPDVLVDDREVGWVCPPEVHPDGWHGHAFGSAYDLPSLDAAVAWVLRRTRPDVWRAERGPVARVELTAGGWRVIAPCHIEGCDGARHAVWWTNRRYALEYAESRVDAARKVTR